MQFDCLYEINMTMNEKKYKPQVKEKIWYKGEEVKRTIKIVK